MIAKRRRHYPKFKVRVALEALRGIKKGFDIHPAQGSR
jgi:hypothetical protein